MLTVIIVYDCLITCPVLYVDSTLFFYNCINTSFICNSYLLYACTTLYLYYYNMYMFTVIVVYNCFITCTICNSYLLYTCSTIMYYLLTVICGI